MKETRIKMLLDVLSHLQKVRNLYKDASPAWILIHAAQGHLKSIHHLETETTFDDETLGGIDETEYLLKSEANAKRLNESILSTKSE